MFDSNSSVVIIKSLLESETEKETIDERIDARKWLAQKFLDNNISDDLDIRHIRIPLGDRPNVKKFDWCTT